VKSADAARMGYHPIRAPFSLDHLPWMGGEGRFSHTSIQKDDPLRTRHEAPVVEDPHLIEVPFRSWQVALWELDHADRLYQPAILFHANLDRLSPPLRAANSAYSIWSLSRLAVGSRLVLQSTYSLPLELAHRPYRKAAFEDLLAPLFDEWIPKSFNTAGPGYLAYIPGGGIFHAALADLEAMVADIYQAIAAGLASPSTLAAWAPLDSGSADLPSASLADDKRLEPGPANGARYASCAAKHLVASDDGVARSTLHPTEALERQCQGRRHHHGYPPPGLAPGPASVVFSFAHHGS